MRGISIGFASPQALLLALLALVPLVALALARARNVRAARTLGLRPDRTWTWLGAPLGAVGACVVLALAAAQPLLSVGADREGRTRSEIFFVVDVSRSMAAARTPGGTMRIERARQAVSRLRATVPDVPAGIAGLTDRVLPYVLPTDDAGVLEAALASSVAIDAPPPQEVAAVSTSFDALAALGADGYFRRGLARRTCVLVSDGESAPFSPSEVGGLVGCRLLAVRIGSPSERVFRADGVPEANYRPAPDAASNLDRLAVAAGGGAFGEDELAAAGAALRTAAEGGPQGRSAGGSDRYPLAPWAALAALALVLAVVVGRVGATPDDENATPVYHGASEPR